jgi:hypothetical protein
VTEAELLVCSDPESMIAFIRGRVSDRKLRLFGCSSCRRVWHLLPDDRSREAILAVERSAGEGAEPADLEGVRLKAREAVRTVAGRRYGSSYERAVYRGAAMAAAHLTAKRMEGVVASLVSGVVTAIAGEAGLAGARRGEAALARSVAQKRELAAQCQLLLEVFGNPFRPVVLDPRWRTEDVLGLARGIYEDRAFDRLPLLVDALMDAGCDDEAMLAHCRGEGPHVRGCWVVDLVLGKE